MHVYIPPPLRITGAVATAVRVYIPLPISLCITGAVTTEVCVHPAPDIPLQHMCGYNRTMRASSHVPLQHRWARYWEVDELAALWESGDAFVQGQVVTGFWEYFVFDNDLRSSEEPNALNFRLKQVTP